MSNNLATSLYNTLTHPDTMRTLLSNFFTDSKDQAIALLQQSGVAISNSAPISVVRTAWLKAMMTSQTFREQASATLTNYVTVTKARLVPGATNFVGNNNARYYNDLDDSDDDSGDFTFFQGASDTSADTSATYTPITTGLASIGSGPSVSVAPLTVSAPVTNYPVTPVAVSAPTAAAAPAAAAASTASSGSFWSSLGQVFTPKVIQAGITTGLQAYSTQLTASANNTSEQNALALENTKLAEAQLAATTGSGLSTGWMIVIGVIGGVILLTTIVVLTKKK